MAVPNLRRAVRGWVKTQTAQVTTQSIVNHRPTETTSSITAKMNFQPMPPAQVNRKPEEQRTWKWWSIIIQSKTVLLKTDDIIVDENGLSLRVEKANDWRTSGFSKYEAREDYGSN